MKTYTFKDLVEIMQNCTSAEKDKEELVAWVTSLGIPQSEMAEFLDFAGNTFAAVGKVLMTRDVRPEEFLSAVYAAGFEMGVRFQETRGIVI